jgi:hypothetical protein
MMHVVARTVRNGLACLALSGALVVGLPAAPSQAAPVPPKSGDVHVAVVSPLISTMEFGATVGFPLMCNTAAGTASAGVAQIPGASDVLTPAFAQFSPFCGSVSEQGGEGLATMNNQLAPLEAINPATSPGFAAMAPVFEQLNTLAPNLQPLSGFITSLGPMVEFFEGAPKS